MTRFSGIFGQILHLFSTSGPMPAIGLRQASVSVPEQALQPGYHGDRALRRPLRLGPVPANQGGGEASSPSGL